MRRTVIISVLFALALIAQVTVVLAQGALVITIQATASNSNQITFTGQVTQAGGPVANAVVVYEIRSANSSLIASGFTTANATGAYSRSLTVLSSSAPGPYTIYVSASHNGQSASSSTSIQPIPEFPASAVPLLLFLSLCILASKKVPRRDSRGNQQVPNALA
jgi:hypothetical protein